MEPPSRIIVNADDLGLTSAVNDAVFGLMCDGRISSATVLVAGEAVEEVARHARRFPRCSFGVHLCLTELRPVRPTAALAPLLDRQGSFGQRHVVKAARPVPALLRAVSEEWVAQIERARSLGLPVSHVDSHHHVHTIPWLLPVLKRVLRAARVGRVRISRTAYAADDPNLPSASSAAKKRLFNAALRYWPPAVRTTSAFTDLAAFMALAPGGTVRVPTIELMTHPGNPDFEAETALLRTPWRDALRWPTALMSYDQL